MIGKTLAHYEITAAIGKGGMGEVYQATDKKLGRSVAIKVLPEEFAQDAERVARFEREAKLLASLNHPNIAAIYGLEESEGTRFLVLELVDGQTLSERLVRGPLPVLESLQLALQIAEALEAAHEEGVIHRDLKPANIKVTSEGKVKVLDFGLAKAFAGAAVGDETVLETLAEGAESGKGVLLGTPSYMSPEQASRQPADHRSDVWAFGCVLFEMLTGKVVFKGNTLSHTIAAILEREPDFVVLPRHLNPAVRRLLERCLAKNPKRRLHSIADVRLEIDDILSSPAGTPAQATPQGRRLLPYAATIALAIVFGALGTWYIRPVPQPEPRPVTRFDLELPDGQSFEQNFQYPLLTVSPNGTQIVYVANSQLHVWDLGLDVTRPISGTEDNPVDPMFSPDGNWVAYFSLATRQLKKIGVDGGTAVPLSDVASWYQGSWVGSDSIVYGDRDGILRASANARDVQLLIPASEEEVLSLPQILPNGTSVLYGVTVIGGPTSSAIQSIGSSERTVLLDGDRSIGARYVPTGHLVYGLGDRLVAVGLDIERRELTGSPVPVLDGILINSSAHFAFGADGSLAYVPRAIDESNSSLLWISREGQTDSFVSGNRSHNRAVVSPDGDRVATLVRGDSGAHIWIYDIESRTPVQLTSDERQTFSLAWSADGARVTYAVGNAIYWQRADGTELPQLLLEHEQAVGALNWSSDGRFLAFSGGFMAQGRIWVFSVDEGTTTLFLESDSRAGAQKFSPNGRWISYARTGEVGEVWVAPFPGPGSASPVYRGDGLFGGWNTWSGNGDYLYFRGIGSDRQKMLAVPVETEAGFRRGEVETLFEVPFEFGVFGLDRKRDRFLIVRYGSRADRRINIVQNWLEELKEKVPVP